MKHGSMAVAVRRRVVFLSLLILTSVASAAPVVVTIRGKVTEVGGTGIPSGIIAGHRFDLEFAYDSSDATILQQGNSFSNYSVRSSRSRAVIKVNGSTVPLSPSYQVVNVNYNGMMIGQGYFSDVVFFAGGGPFSPSLSLQIRSAYTSTPAVSSVVSSKSLPVALSDVDIERASTLTAGYFSSPAGGGWWMALTPDTSTFRIVPESPPIQVSGSRIRTISALANAIHVRIVPTEPRGSQPTIQYRLDVSSVSGSFSKYVNASLDGTASVMVSDLLNGTTYSVRATAIAASGLAGTTSPSKFAKPTFPEPIATEPVGEISSPIVLLHGFASDGDVWGITKKYLADLGKFNQVDSPSFSSRTFNVCEEAIELKQFIANAKARSGQDKVVLVGHSQGGLVARTYLQAGSKPADFAGRVVEGTLPFPSETLCYEALGLSAPLHDGNNAGVAALVTYGTPHNGADNIVVEDVHRLLRPNSRFLNALNDFEAFRLPKDIPITNLQGATSPISGDDCVVSAESQSMRTVGYEGQVDVVRKNWRRHSANAPCPLSGAFRTSEVEDGAAIAEALGAIGVLRVRLGSPATLRVIDPSGKVIDANKTELWGAIYEENEDDLGHRSDNVEIPAPLPGNYQIYVLPDPSASPTDPYSLFIERSGAEAAVVIGAPIGTIGPDPVITRVNWRPIAIADSVSIARLGSTVSLDGSRSHDPDGQPVPLVYQWRQESGPLVRSIDRSAMISYFSPASEGLYRFALTVFDGESFSAISVVSVEIPKYGDIDRDGDVDDDDKRLIMSSLNTTADGSNDLRDLSGDGRITGEDVSLLVRSCTRRACATR